MIQLYRSTAYSSKMNPLAYRAIRTGKDADVHLRIITDQDKYSVYYSGKGFSWQLLAGGIYRRSISTNTAGGFVGSVFGLYSTAPGHPPAAGRLITIG